MRKKRGHNDCPTRLKPFYIINCLPEQKTKIEEKKRRRKCAKIKVHPNFWAKNIIVPDSKKNKLHYNLQYINQKETPLFYVGPKLKNFTLKNIN